MKYLITVASLIALAASTAIPRDNVEGEDRYVWMPNDKGVPHLVDLKEPIDYDALHDAQTKDTQRDLSGNAYWLFTRSNPTTAQVITNGDANSLLNSNYNSSLDLIVIVHGWLNSGSHEVNTMITESYLKVKDVNIIVVDWTLVAALPYPASAAGVIAVGHGIGNFIEFAFNTSGGSLSTTHLIGWSLGAHAVGIASRGLSSGVVARITGLDAAGPLWDVNLESLSASDANYVEAIHTDINNLGISRTVGDADFYPNGGTLMPGCLTSACNHERSYHYFAASVENDHFVGRHCANLAAALAHLCVGTPTLNMGNSDISKTGSGIFGLTTGAQWPY